MDANHVKIGTIVSKHGFKGHIKIKIDSYNLNNIPQLDFLFIDIDKCMIPFKVEEIKSFNSDILILKLNELDPEKQINEVLFNEVYINNKFIESTKEDSFFYDELIGFNVFKNQKKVGSIISIISNLPQPVFEVLISSKKFMIPIHEDLIEKIDKNKKEIHIIIPEGLLEIF